MLNANFNNLIVHLRLFSYLLDMIKPIDIRKNLRAFRTQ